MGKAMIYIPRVFAQLKRKTIAERVQSLEQELTMLQGAERSRQATRHTEAQKTFQLQQYGAALASSVSEQRDVIRLLVERCERDGEALHIFLSGGT